MRTGNQNMTTIIFLIAMVSIGWGVAFISLATLLKVMAPMQLLAARWGITGFLFLIREDTLLQSCPLLKALSNYLLQHLKLEV